jgi:hypothetical protein
MWSLYGHAAGYEGLLAGAAIGVGSWLGCRATLKRMKELRLGKPGALAMMKWWLVLTVLFAAAASATPPDPTAATLRPDPCQQSPTQDLLPEVAPMIGIHPVWLVDGSATWRKGKPVKTLWVLARTSADVRIEGRRLDGPGVLTFQRGDDPPADVLAIANPATQSVIPSGASPDTTRAYVFLPSHVLYPSPGCWEFTVRMGEETTRVVRDLKPDNRVQ